MGINHLNIRGDRSQHNQNYDSDIFGCDNTIGGNFCVMWKNTEHTTVSAWTNYVINGINNPVTQNVIYNH